MIYLLNSLDKEKFSIILVCPKESTYLKEIKDVKVIPHTLNSVRTKLGLKFIYTIYWLLKLVYKEKVDIIHANGWRAPWFVAPFSFITKAKTIWHHRDNLNSFLYNILLPLGFNKIICISEFVKSTLNTKKAVVIYNGVPVKNNHKKYLLEKRNTDNFTIGVFGRIVEWKRFDYIIEAIYELSKLVDVSNIKLLIVGDTTIDGSDKYLRNLQNLIQEYNLTEIIEFYGYSNKPMELMRSCDITINFSDKEPFGRVIIESIIVGTPVIVADSGGAPEIIKITQGGVICKDGDTKQLASLIQRFMVMDNEEYINMVVKGIKGVEKHFNVDEISKKVMKEYLVIMKGWERI
ncbi:glycosyl transferase group 1 [Thalassobacillus devorans]|uniref:Glycosyl transferase group 1 n=2 Tax=Thalassobacillus devorans TaxID=279813 RepID=A0ABQ1NUC6_9BACI|nr:glycosyltransferase involved in cell wall biosynthesis [Thalassobacillus devorans]GGC84919.1 glycosyl transferase group 1 [Thalassobacillus devorans]